MLTQILHNVYTKIIVRVAVVVLVCVRALCKSYILGHINLTWVISVALTSSHM